jgi:hypothetical protein
VGGKYRYGGKERRRAGLKTLKLLPAREGEIGWCASHFVVVNDIHPARYISESSNLAKQS